VCFEITHTFVPHSGAKVERGSSVALHPHGTYSPPRPPDDPELQTIALGAIAQQEGVSRGARMISCMQVAVMLLALQA
jgi:hypothetical protein